MSLDDLKKMTVAELREEAKKLGDVTGLASMKKDELVKLLSGGADATVGETRRGRPGKNARLSRAELKQRIRALKKERSSAGERMAKAKVEEFNTQLRLFRRKLRRAARHKAA
jgi:Rho termination factor, N-terminal domain